jgi:PIN domain nuclease of toxin-antitoxin system
MKLILDTHAFIWWDEEPKRLGPAAQVECMNRANTLVLSLASVWEMQIKLSLGKLALRKPLREIINEQIRRNAMEILQIKLEHGLRLESLPLHHKDPFDRMLISQTIEENCQIVSHDLIISKYNVDVVW